MHIEHLQDAELVQRLAGREARCFEPKPVLQGDLNAVSDERDEDMSFDAVFALVLDRPHHQIAFQLFEGGFDFAQLQVELPERGGIGAAHVRAQEITSLAPSGQAQLGFIEREAEIHAPRPLSFRWRLG